jgi:hypothetical protein
VSLTTLILASVFTLPLSAQAEGKKHESCADQLQTNSQRAVEWANTQLFQELTHSEHVRFVTLEKPGTMYFQPETWSVYGDFQALDEQSARALSVHEYAHAVFIQNMIPLAPDWRHWQEDVARFDRETMPKLQELENEQFRLLRLLEPLTDLLHDGQRLPPESDVEIIRLKAALDELHRRANALKEKYAPRAPQLFQLSLPYQELFCDLAGALSVGDFDAYGIILLQELDRRGHESGTDMRWLRYRAVLEIERDFTHQVPVANWNQSLAIMTPLPINHLLFNPARSFLFERYLKKPQVREHIGAFIAQVFHALAAEIVAQSQRPPGAPNDPETLNHQLIERFSKELSAFE